MRCGRARSTRSPSNSTPARATRRREGPPTYPSSTSRGSSSSPRAPCCSHDVIDLSRLGMPWLGLDPAAASAKAIRRVRRELGGEESTQHTFFSYQNALALVAAGRRGHPGTRTGSGVPPDQGRRPPRHPRSGDAAGRAAPPHPKPRRQPDPGHRHRPDPRGRGGVLLRILRHVMACHPSNRARPQPGHSSSLRTEAGRSPAPTDSVAGEIEVIPRASPSDRIRPGAHS